MLQKQNKKIITGWAMYDWANSVYNLIITTTFFPIYYIAVTEDSFKNGVVNFFGIKIVNTVLYDYAIASAYFIAVLFIPLLSALADLYKNKLLYLRIFSFLGAASCSALYFFYGYNIEFGIIFFILATVGYCGSLVFYNSYLPEIAPKEQQDAVSAKGYIYGYVGSVIMQLIGFGLILILPFGMTKGEAIRITFLLVGVWWFVFALFTFSRLKLIPKVLSTKSQHKTIKQIITENYTILIHVAKEINNHSYVKIFLWAFFFYNMGVQTVMLIAMSFGTKLLNIPSTNLLIVALILQIVAILGAYVTVYISKHVGNIKTIILIVLLWIGVCGFGYFISTAIEFYILAILVGMVMGAIQSMSRATFSKLMPPLDEHTSYFSFYDVVEKLTVIIGLFGFGFIEQITNNMRNSVLLLMVFFVIGLCFLFPLRNIKSTN